MEHDDHKQQKMTFSTAGAKLGFLSYVMLALVIAFIFILG